VVLPIFTEKNEKVHELKKMNEQICYQSDMIELQKTCIVMIRCNAQLHSWCSVVQLLLERDFKKNLNPLNSSLHHYGMSIRVHD